MHDSQSGQSFWLAVFCAVKHRPHDLCGRCYIMYQIYESVQVICLILSESSIVFLRELCHRHWLCVEVSLNQIAFLLCQKFYLFSALNTLCNDFHV